MTSTSIARLKITLDDVKPAVLRRIEVPLTIRLDRLHLVLQAAMGWTNSHLYEIRARDVGWGVPDPDWGEGPLDARKARLLDILEDTGAKTLQYLYDFSDGWEHTEGRAHYGSCARPQLPVPDQRYRALPARGRRRTLGLRRVPRGDRRPEAREPCRDAPMGRRAFRSQHRRLR